MKIKQILCLVSIGYLAVFQTGCTSVTVEPVNSQSAGTGVVIGDIDGVCIKNNPAVKVEDFVPVIRERLNHHGIKSKVIEGNSSSVECPYVLEYTAKRSWDLVTYLSHAELILKNNDNKVVGKAVYHLRGKGGLALTKFQGTKEKITPVVDQLFGKTVQ